MIITQNIFPVTIASTSWQDRHLLGEEFDAELDRLLLGLAGETEVDTKLLTLVGNNHSTFRYTTDFMLIKQAEPFRKWIEQIKHEMWTAIGYEECQIAIERSWVNKLGQGAGLRPHAHGSTEMVMTYYHKAPPGSGKLKLYNPYENTGMAPYSNKVIEIEPTEGTLYAWPGYLWHEVEQHNLESERVAISMNVHQGSHTISNRWKKVS